ncbi:hypothetical protein EF918_05795 [Streptomyces sp. WAC06614]|nr:hypothetical protein EF918_05795 [Streptomyces sp. WAC06614]
MTPYVSSIAPPSGALTCADIAVRAAGVTVLRRAGRSAEATAHLTDRAAIVRACARGWAPAAAPTRTPTTWACACSARPARTRCCRGSTPPSPPCGRRRGPTSGGGTGA